jgi:ectoine hydroxylase-related dioxygenase (phytanoyl-CoA dioxygenase family)
MARSITPALVDVPVDVDVDKFRRDGFVAVQNVFSKDELARFRDAVDAGVNARVDELPPMEERDPYDRMFRQHYNLWEDSAGVRALTFHPRVAEIASVLLDARRVRVYCDQSFYKEPGSTETGVHQDYRLLCIEQTATLNAWIPLEGSTLEAGALGYLPGSHRFGAMTNVDFALGRDLLELPELRALLDAPVFLELEPGSVAFHHVLTFHLSAPNRTERTRKAFAVTYFADGGTRGSAWPHASVDRTDIAVGESIVGPAVPLAWPASPTLPETPPPIPHPPRGWPGRSAPAPDRRP